MSHRHAVIARLTIACLCACAGTPASDPAPVDIGPDVACAVDGMLLSVHQGPKSQLLRTDGSRAFFCDTREIFGELLDPVRRRRVEGIWFQSVDRGGWEARGDGWAAPESLLFVAGSARLGDMGPTLAPFASEEEARRFVDEHGGRVLGFGEIDAAVIEQLEREGRAAFD